MFGRYLLMALAVATMSTLVACGAGPPPMPAPPSGQSHQADSDYAVVAESTRQGRRARSEVAQRSSAPMVQPGTGSAPASDGAAPTPPQEEEPTPRGQQLIYTGSVTLAIYDVEATQEAAIALVEDLGGYVSERSSKSITARVPAAQFRDALTALGALGDLLDQTWRAQDVTDEMRDLDIRLRNATELRNRLEILLERAESIEEALAIEAELERITLEIERIRGTLLSFEDRVAYSTIQLRFQPIQTDQVPDDRFLLPFSWLYTLGLESLLRTPEMYR